MTNNDLMKNFYRSCDRRTFLKALGVFAGGAAVGGTLQAAFDVVKIGRGLYKVDRTLVRMGTYVTLTAVHESRDQAQEAIGRAFEEMDRLIAIFSRHDPSSPVSLLNDSGTLRRPPIELVELVERSLHVQKLSGGAFDITVKPVLDLLRETVGTGGPAPGRGEIEKTLTRVGSDKMEVSAGKLGFRRPGMGITLDAIAKGHIVDRASDVLARCGVENSLINAGGDIRARGARAAAKPWTIAVEDPKKSGRYPEVIRLTNGAVATSGSYEIYFDEERVFHHVVDPRSGESPHHSAGASIVADHVERADALSTAVFVLGPAAGVGLVDGMADIECLVIDGGGAEYRSKGWNKFSASHSNGRKIG